jgi:hypothetical protein
MPVLTGKGEGGRMMEGWNDGVGDQRARDRVTASPGCNKVYSFEKSSRNAAANQRRCSNEKWNKVYSFRANVRFKMRGLGREGMI